MSQEDLRDKIFKIAQEYSQSRPLIIWGSGATIPLGMPSMDDLKQELDIVEAGNLENILSNIDDEHQKDAYEKKIFEIINNKDAEFRRNLSPKIMEPIKKFIELQTQDTQILNIITSNYDCILEYVLAYYNMPFSDGFTGYELSQFNKDRFRQTMRNHKFSVNEIKQFINLYKVHGSIRWCNRQYSHYNDKMDAIFPTTDKYEKTHQEPFRTLINKADEAIEQAGCLLSIGFGFNDEHLTPKIEAEIEQGKSIIVIAKESTDSCKDKLFRAKKYMLIENGTEPNTTQFTFKENGNQYIKQLRGTYWIINQFNHMIGED